MATHHGSMPTGISAVLVLASPATLKTETELLSGLTLQTSASSPVMAMGLECVGVDAVWAVADRNTRPAPGSPAFHRPTMPMAPITRTHPHLFRPLCIAPPPVDRPVPSRIAESHLAAS